MKEIILGCVTAFFVVLLATPSLITVAKLKKLVDEPNEDRKKQKDSIPTIGGIIIFAASIFAYSMWFPWDDLSYYGSPYLFAEAVKEFKLLMAAAILIFFIGVKDDIIGVDPLKKLVGHGIVGFILVIMADIRITDMQGIFGIGELPYMVSIALSIFSYIVVVNAFNLIDGSDGLAAGTGVITSFFFGLWFYFTKQYDDSLLAFVLAGSLLAFLVFNFMPAKIYMGDSGSLFIGATTFALTVKCIETDANLTPAMLKQLSPAVFALAVLAYPLVDTLRVFTIRIFNGVSPFSADRNHLHHMLIDSGQTHRYTALVLYGVSICIPLFIVLTKEMNATVAFLFMLFVAVGLTHAVWFFRKRKKKAAQMVPLAE